MPTNEFNETSTKTKLITMEDTQTDKTLSTQNIDSESITLRTPETPSTQSTNYSPTVKDTTQPNETFSDQIERLNHMVLSILSIDDINEISSTQSTNPKTDTSSITQLNEIASIHTTDAKPTDLESIDPKPITLDTTLPHETSGTQTTDPNFIILDAISPNEASRFQITIPNQTIVTVKQSDETSTQTTNPMPHTTDYRQPTDPSRIRISDFDARIMDWARRIETSSTHDADLTPNTTDTPNLSNTTPLAPNARKALRQSNQMYWNDPEILNPTIRSITPSNDTPDFNPEIMDTAWRIETSTAHTPDLGPTFEVLPVAPHTLQALEEAKEAHADDAKIMGILGKISDALEEDQSETGASSVMLDMEWADLDILYEGLMEMTGGGEAVGTGAQMDGEFGRYDGRFSIEEDLARYDKAMLDMIGECSGYEGIMEVLDADGCGYDGMLGMGGEFGGYGGILDVDDEFGGYGGILEVDDEFGLGSEGGEDSLY